MLGSVTRNPWVRAAAVLAAIACVGLFCYILSPVLVSLLFAFLVAYVLDPVVDAFERRGIARGWAIGFVALAAIVVVLCLAGFVVVNLFSGAQHLLHAGAQNFQNGSVYSLAAPVLHWVRPWVASALTYAGLVPPDYPPDDVGVFISQRIGDYVHQNAVSIVQSYGASVANAGRTAGMTAAQALSSLGKNAFGLLELIANIAVFTVVTVYLLKDFDDIVASARDLIPPRRRAYAVSIIARIDEQIHGFLRGQITVCACLGIMYSAGLLISGVPFALPIGLIGGAASFVPYLGFALTSIPSVILALLQHGIDWHILGVVATFLIAQSLESMVLTPKIVGDKVGLGPVWVILAIMVFSSFLGFAGLLLAVPIAAALKVLVLEGLAYYRSSSLFAASASDAAASAVATGASDPAASLAPAAAGAARRPRKRPTKSS